MRRCFCRSRVGNYGAARLLLARMARNVYNEGTKAMMETSMPVEADSESGVGVSRTSKPG